jgi:hypothetical protein
MIIALVITALVIALMGTVWLRLLRQRAAERRRKLEAVQPIEISEVLEQLGAEPLHDVRIPAKLRAVRDTAPDFPVPPPRRRPDGRGRAREAQAGSRRGARDL